MDFIEGLPALALGLPHLLLAFFVEERGPAFGFHVWFLPSYPIVSAFAVVYVCEWHKRGFD
jgi:hypothetical protein